MFCDYEELNIYVPTQFGNKKHAYFPYHGYILYIEK